MNVCGIIAEYNPFHNGHEYHLKKAVEQTNADFTVVVMSGNFVQRGAPAIIDKHFRTEAALRCGVDLVLELPAFYATASAEYFAAGAVSLLDKLGAVTHLCFGSECGDLTLLEKIAQVYADEPDNFKEILRQKAKAGVSFPAARAAALIDLFPEFHSSVSTLSSPNNILGIEYIKALKKCNSTILPVTIPRSGSGYHDRELTHTLSSATAIRQSIELEGSTKIPASQLPSAAAEIYEKYFADSAPVFSDDISALLHYKLICQQNTGYSEYLDISEDLSDRIQKNVYRFTSFSCFCDLLKTREITYSRISRCLLHILLDIRKADVSMYVNELSYTPYARILGFRKDAAPLLKEISSHTQIPLISKLADAHKILTEPQMDMLRKDIMISHIYSSIRAEKKPGVMQNEYTTPIVIL